VYTLCRYSRRPEADAAKDTPKPTPFCVKSLPLIPFQPPSSPSTRSNSPSTTSLDKARSALAKGDLHTAMAEALAAQVTAGARRKADIELTVGQVRARVGHTAEAETSLRSAVELAKKEKGCNWVAERTANYELGLLAKSARPPDYDTAVTLLARSVELHAAGRGAADQLAHMRAGNALAACLRKLRRYEEAVQVFLAVARLNCKEIETNYEECRCAVWREDRPATAVSEARVWSGAGFAETAAAQHKIRSRDKSGKQSGGGTAALFASVRSERPAAFMHSTWGDPADDRPASSAGDRARAMKRNEDDIKRERVERTARRHEAGLPPLPSPS